MENFVLIFICFAIGILFRLYKIFPPTASQVLNRFVIYISLPALTLSQVHRLSLKGNLWVPASMPWIVFVLGLGFFYLAGKYMKIPTKSVGTLSLTGSLGNTSFLGFPILEALYGIGALSVGILVDQLGSFLLTGSLGVATAAYYAGGSVNLKTIARRVFSFPPFIVLILAFFLRSVNFSNEVFHILDRLASTMVPVSLISVGTQLQFHPEKIRAHFKPLFLGLGFKLVLAPLFCVLLYLGAFQLRGEAVLITLIESTMAPMITAGVIATEYELDADLASLMVGIGIPLSFITVPLWAWILSGV